MTAESLVLQLQAALSQLNTLPESDRRGLAQQYVDACAAVNRRLTTCALYLRRGYLGEAIRLCELQPHLLDEINALNFAQRATWNANAQQWGFPAPDLAMSLAVEVNDAYDRWHKTEQKSGEFRLLNTLQRPPAERIAVLKELRRLDPPNQVWEDNLHRLAE